MNLWFALKNDQQFSCNGQLACIWRENRWLVVKDLHPYLSYISWTNVARMSRLVWYICFNNNQRTSNKYRELWRILEPPCLIKNGWHLNYICAGEKIKGAFARSRSHFQSIIAPKRKELYYLDKTSTRGYNDASSSVLSNELFELFEPVELFFELGRFKTLLFSL